MRGSIAKGVYDVEGTTMILRRAGIVSIAGVVSMFVAGAAACGGSDSDVATARAGSEGGPCPTNGESCDVGLVCLSKTCVKPVQGDADSTSSSSSGGSSGTPSDGSVSVDANAFDAAACKYQHPLVDAGLRYCDPGHCYCKKTDGCNAKALAALCCEGNEGTCY
jgi:hypothetical protein